MAKGINFLLFEPLRFFGNKIYASSLEDWVPHLKEDPWDFGVGYVMWRGFLSCNASCTDGTWIWWWKTSFRGCYTSWIGVFVQTRWGTMPGMPGWFGWYLQMLPFEWEADFRDCQCCLMMFRSFLFSIVVRISPTDYGCLPSGWNLSLILCLFDADISPLCLVGHELRLWFYHLI